MSAFQAVIEKYRKLSYSQKDKGYRFELLMQRFLTSDPKYSGIIKQVWLWNDFPYRKDFGGKDTGIDLVALTNNGEYWAVQCKCYDGETYIDKPAVDSFLATSSKSFRDEKLEKHFFSFRLWISTTNKWGANAEETIKNQKPEVGRIDLTYLENAPVDWLELEKGTSGKAARNPQKKLRPHQKTALSCAHEYFKRADRGKLIMACGTGKTYTSLKIAECETDNKGLILLLVPSIALMSQTLDEWTSEAATDIEAICVCSDAEVSKKKSKDEDTQFTQIEDLALPATTNIPEVISRLRTVLEKKKDGLTLVLSTYQSIEVISKAQKELNSRNMNKCIFDMIICDEAHRTTGVTLADEDESAFTKVHSNDFINAKKRMYMTATPRLYKDSAKKAAAEKDAILCSMDDKEIYGDEIYRIGFGESVDNGLLADYKVIILTIDNIFIKDLPEPLRKMITDTKTDDAKKLVGCVNALAKRESKLTGAGIFKEVDPDPMKRAVAFCQTIAVSKQTTEIFNSYKEIYYEKLTQSERAEMVDISADHIDGTMNATLRSEKLSWLKSENRGERECRILTNVRCLSEGVDVPALDAVLFLSARNSEIDVVQSVGRVMRTATQSGKKYGYIIIPVIVPPDKDPEAILEDDSHFKVVWTILRALRAHDDRFDATVEEIKFGKKRPENISIIGGHSGDSYGGDGRVSSPYGSSYNENEKIKNAILEKFESFKDIIYARMVLKVGNKEYMEQWASAVAEVAKRNTARIKALAKEDGKHKRVFEQFLAGLQRSLNPSITSDDAIDMLAQHIITRPIFEALFGNYSFVKNNPVSASMQEMLDLFDEKTTYEDKETMRRFFDSISRSVGGIESADARQHVIKELYEKFFKIAFPNVVEKLGIVYTPVEVVDFIINSVSDILQKEFHRDISDKDVHIIDPFVGTGTFITRLLQSGRILPEAMEYKYQNEIHANEIVLLAYYIASINIESVYHDIAGEQTEYVPFNGICLTDTFQLGETISRKQKDVGDMFRQNSERVTAQQNAPLRIIIGNPPYSVGQKSANDNSQNQSYPHLEKRIAETYAAKATATNKNSLYDSYIKAFRWASDRLAPETGGIIAFVSNGSWLDGNATAGFRKCLESEFSSIYVFNLRGNARTSGEQRQKEKGNVFGSGSRTPIAITLLVKNRAKAGKAEIHYRDIGDYLSRKEKLDIVKKFDSFTAPDFEMQKLTPNHHGDWISQRNEVFNTFIPIGDKNNKGTQTFFVPHYSNGLKTQRDAWCYNSSKDVLCKNIRSTIDFYNTQRKALHDAKTKDSNITAENFVDRYSTKISWTRALLNDVSNNKEFTFSKKSVRVALYRPFYKQYLYFSRSLNEMVYQIPKQFPTPGQENLVICVSGLGGKKDNSAFISNTIVDLNCLDAGTQCFPLYYYDEPVLDGVKAKQANLFDMGEETQYKRHDGVTDFILKRAQENYGKKVTKEDIFYYVYGLLHSQIYRKKFASDLKKMLPRITLVEEPQKFWAFSKAGRGLAELHINYETVDRWPVKEHITAPNYTVEKMRFGKKNGKDDKTIINYNSNVTISGIPLEAYDYVVNGKSSIEWIMERYAVTINTESKIKNDPNDWAKEQGNPRYIIDLLESVITVSVETMKIVNNMPDISEDLK